jgi:hypothetical protein
MDSIADSLMALTMDILFDLDIIEERDDDMFLLILLLPLLFDSLILCSPLNYLISQIIPSYYEDEEEEEEEDYLLGVLLRGLILKMSVSISREG